MIRHLIAIATIVFSSFSLAGSGGPSSHGDIMTNTEAKEFLSEMFREILDPSNETRATAAQYMTPDYIQLVDGKEIGFDGFVDHIQVLHGELKSINITVQEVIVSGNTLADIHFVDAVKNDGSKLKAKVIGFWYLRDDGKVQKLDELTFMLEGSEEDKDMGSRTSQ